MKKIKKIEKHFPSKKRYDGIFDPERMDLELSGDIVSSTEMTGAVPTAPAENEPDQTLKA